MKSCRSWTASNSPVASRLTRPRRPSRRWTSSLAFSIDGTESSSVSVARADLRLEAVSFAQKTLGVANPSLDVPAEPVVLLVGLPQPVELGRRLTPGLVDLGFAGRRRALRRGGGVPLVAGFARAVLGSGGGLLGRHPRRLRLLQCRSQLLRIVCRCLVPLGLQSRPPRVRRRAIPSEGLHHHARLDRRLRERRQLGDVLRARRSELGQSIAGDGLRFAHGPEPFGEQLLLLPGRGEVPLEGGESLGGDRDVGIGGLDLLVQELDLLRRLSQALALWLQPAAGPREIVSEDLELRPDLASPRVDLFGRVDHGGSHQGSVRRDERGALGARACFSAASSIESAR